MDLQSALQRLEALGTEEGRHAGARCGVTWPTFGVSAVGFEELVKEINTDHALARELWATGNHDARMLATMIADPLQTDASLLESWRADLNNHVVTDALAALAARTPLGLEQVDGWCAADDEWSGQLGWNLVGRMARDDGAYPDDYFDAKLEVLEREIHARKNRTRHAMNEALMNIARRNSALRDKALAAAQRIGPVLVDHGETGGHTPDAAEVIRGMAEARAAASVAAPASAPVGRARRGPTVRARSGAKAAGKRMARAKARVAKRAKSARRGKPTKRGKSAKRAKPPKRKKKAAAKRTRPTAAKQKTRGVKKSRARTAKKKRGKRGRR